MKNASKRIRSVIIVLSIELTVVQFYSSTRDLTDKSRREIAGLNTLRVFGSTSKGSLANYSLALSDPSRDTGRVRCKALECLVNYAVRKMYSSLTRRHFPRITGPVRRSSSSYILAREHFTYTRLR